MISERSNPYYYAIYYSEYSCRKFFSFFASTLFPIIFSHFSFSFSRDDDLFVFFPPSRGNRQIFLFSPTSEDPSPPAVRSAIVNFAITNTNFSNSIDRRFFHHFWQKQKKKTKQKKRKTWWILSDLFSPSSHTESLKRVLREYHNRITALEDQKFDLEYVVKKKDYEVLTREGGKDNVARNYITIRANDVAFTHAYIYVYLCTYTYIYRNDAQCCCTWVMRRACPVAFNRDDESCLGYLGTLANSSKRATDLTQSRLFINSQSLFLLFYHHLFIHLFPPLLFYFVLFLSFFLPQVFSENLSPPTSISK